MIRERERQPWTEQNRTEQNRTEQNRKQNHKQYTYILYVQHNICNIWITLCEKQIFSNRRKLSAKETCLAERHLIEQSYREKEFFISFNKINKINKGHMKVIVFIFSSVNDCIFYVINTINGHYFQKNNIHFFFILYIGTLKYETRILETHMWFLKIPKLTFG